MATFAPVVPQVTSIPNTTVGGRNTGTATGFIPEIWSDEIKASYTNNLVLASKIKTMAMKGKKGDTIHVPIPDRGTASVKAPETAVTLIAGATSDLQINIDQHFEYSCMIEDIAGTQALSSLRSFYTEDAGFAMAVNVDTSLFNLGVGLDGGSIDQNPATAAHWVSPQAFYPAATTGALTAYNGTTASSAFTDQSLRDGLQTLDDANVPMTGRFFVIPPSLVNTIRGIERFSSSDFVNFKQTSSGEIGNLYGVPVYVSTNVPSVANAGGGTPVERMSLLAHKDAYVLAEQVGIRTQTQYKQEFLSTLMTADRLYGRQVYRAESAVVIAVAP